MTFWNAYGISYSKKIHFMVNYILRNNLDPNGKQNTTMALFLQSKVSN